MVPQFNVTPICNKNIGLLFKNESGRAAAMHNWSEKAREKQKAINLNYSNRHLSNSIIN